VVPARAAAGGVKGSDAAGEKHIRTGTSLGHVDSTWRTAALAKASGIFVVGHLEE